jgi:hypothetical protein
MHVELLPRGAQDMIRAEPSPAREILLGYWNDLLVTSVPGLTRRRADAGLLAGTGRM